MYHVGIKAWTNAAKGNLGIFPDKSMTLSQEEAFLSVKSVSIRQSH